MLSTPLPATTANGQLVPRLPAYSRLNERDLPIMRITERDKQILEAVHAYDGVLSEPQIRQLFFSGRTATQVRLKLLFQHGYLSRPTRRQRAALPTMVYWLGERGAACVAGLTGQSLEEFQWRKEPRWSQIDHDLAVNDLRITFFQACEQANSFTFDEWIPQSEFWAHPDKVEYLLPGGIKASRFIRPDGYAMVTRGDYTGKFLIEVDLATEHNSRIAREKILPGIAYIRSDVYRRRFGYNSGRWLFVTTSDRRLKNMKQQTERVADKDAKLFYFTTFDRISPATLLTTPIWWRGGEETPTTLFKP